MPGPDLVERLAAIGGRGACTDAERRAAILLRDHLRAHGHPARLEPAWVRPQWAAAWALHCALAVVGSLLAVEQPAVGLGIVAATLVSYALDVSGRMHLLRLIFPRRATQVVVSEPPPRPGRVRLILAAPLDVPPAGSVFRYAPLLGRARNALRGHLSSAPAMLAFCMLVIAGLAGARLAGAEGQLLGVVQLVPTVVLLLAVAALVDVALSRPARGEAEAGGVAAAVALASALRENPPRAVDVELVLPGANRLGMRAYIRGKKLRAEDVALLAFGPCGAGPVHHFTHEGLLFPLRLHPLLVELARESETNEVRRGFSLASPARAARWPALALEGGTIAESVERASAIVARLDVHLTARALQSERPGTGPM